MAYYFVSLHARKDFFNESVPAGAGGGRRVGLGGRALAADQHAAAQDHPAHQGSNEGRKEAGGCGTASWRRVGRLCFSRGFHTEVTVYFVGLLWSVQYILK